MSKYRHWWRPDIVRFIRAYPDLRLRKEALRSVSHSMDGVHTAPTRATENIALRQLSPFEEKILDAVQLAIEDIGRSRDGREVLAIVEMVDWGRYSVEGAALKLHISPETAKRRRGRFISEVANNLDF